MFLHSLALLLFDSIISSGSFSAGSSYFCFFFSVCGGACSLLLGFSPFLCYCPSAWKVLTVLCVRVWSEDPYIAFGVGCLFFFCFLYDGSRARRLKRRRRRRRSRWEGSRVSTLSCVYFLLRGVNQERTPVDAQLRVWVGNGHLRWSSEDAPTRRARLFSLCARVSLCKCVVRVCASRSSRGQPMRADCGCGEHGGWVLGRARAAIREAQRPLVARASERASEQNAPGPDRCRAKVFSCGM